MKNPITHIQQNEMQTKMHLSHLFRYISAYEYSEERLEVIQEKLEEALVEAKESYQSQIVDDDGECCLHVHPNQTITLMLPWKSFNLVRKAGMTLYEKIK